MPPEIVGSSMVAPENTFIIGDDDEDDDVEDQIIGEEELGLVHASGFQDAEDAHDREMLTMMGPRCMLGEARTLATASREVRDAFHAREDLADDRSPSPEWDRVPSPDTAGMPIFSGLSLANSSESGGGS